MSDSNEKHKWYLDDARLRQLLTWITGKISSSIPTMTEFTKEEIEVLWNNRLSGTVTPGTSSFSFRINGDSSGNGEIITVTPDSTGNWSWDNVERYEITSTFYMFYNCTNLTSLDVSSFDTSSVTDMNSMFLGCTGLTSLDLTSWYTKNITTYYSSFVDNVNTLTINYKSVNWNSDIPTSFANVHWIDVA